MIVPAILLAALIQVESHGNDRALGDYWLDQPHAFGCLQITDYVLADARRFSGHWWSRGDCFDRNKATRICRVYLEHYATPARLGRDPTMEDMARIWVGGPDGWRKPTTLPYWHKVLRTLAQRGQPDLAAHDTSAQLNDVPLLVVVPDHAC